MNFDSKTFLNWFLFIFWMGIIFFLSSQPDLKSGFESRLDFILRKSAHMAEYAILTFLAWRTLASNKEAKFSKGNSVFKIPRSLIYAIVVSFLYAASDEIHQLFVIGRAGSAGDVLIDGAGIFIAAALILRKELKRNSK